MENPTRVSGASASGTLDSMRRANPHRLDSSAREIRSSPGHYIQVYANQVANQTLRQGKGGPFLIGAVIAKEKLLYSPQGIVAGLAFMIKRGTRQFASTGGWEFAYYPESGESASIQACATCHRSAASKDYVFGQYPSSGDPLRPTQAHSR
jgi:mono/diheme cytochrome c family protein